MRLSRPHLRSRVTGVASVVLLIALIAAVLAFRSPDGRRYVGQSAGAVPTTAPPEPATIAPAPVAPAVVEAPTTIPVPPPPPVAPPPGNLLPPTDQAAFLARVQGEALRQVTAYGLPGYGVVGGGFARVGVPSTVPPAAAPMMGAPGSSSAAPSAAPAQPNSGTNVQEVGVDEPDQAKTDGRLLVSLSGRFLQVVDVTGGPRLASTVALPAEAQPQSILLVGTRALVFSGVFGSVAKPLPETLVSVVELADPNRPRVLRTHRVAGSLVAARLLNGTARVVLAHTPQIPWTTPTTGTTRAQEAALARNREKIRTSTFEQWVAPGTGCTGAFTSPVESGLATIAVRTIDPAATAPGPGVCVASQASTVYASTASLFVGTTTYAAAEALAQGRGGSIEPKTSLHRFDITDAAAARYTGSGEVAGTLLNQFSLSEHEGDLRVATTRRGTPSGSESQVAVLRPRGDTLSQVGLLGGLGLTERIYAVRFVGDIGYVVTFSEMMCDPLFVVDLTDPTRPVLRGSLEVQGFSSYLHPTTPGRVLSIGRDSQTPRAGMMPCGTTSPQISLYDVSDGARPRQLQRLVLPPGFSEAESDHHAFTWWGPSQLLVVPIQLNPPSSFTGALALHVGDGGITEVGRITHPDGGTGQAPIQRSFVVGTRLLTVSDRGVASHDLASLAGQGFTAFPAG